MLRPLQGSSCSANGDEKSIIDAVSEVIVLGAAYPNCPPPPGAKRPDRERTSLAVWPADFISTIKVINFPKSTLEVTFKLWP